MTETSKRSAAGNGIASLAAHLRDRLEAGEWAPGDRLPTERALAERFATTRTAVRKVLAGLREEGLIEQRVGSGTFAGESLRATRHVGPAELMQARIAFEPAIIELAVRNASNADLSRFDECLAAAGQARRTEDFELWDARLHAAIAESTHNAFVATVFRLMGEARRNAEWGELKRRSATAQRRQRYQEEHRAIVAALRARDVERAAARMRAHLVGIRQDLFGE